MKFVGVSCSLGIKANKFSPVELFFELRRESIGVSAGFCLSIKGSKASRYSPIEKKLETIKIVGVYWYLRIKSN